jgi:dipeptidyl aminopeptidase/acylaminoacyl peptidase
MRRCSVLIIWLAAASLCFTAPAASVTLTQLTETGRYPFWSRHGSDLIVYDTVTRIWSISPSGGSPTQITCVLQGGIFNSNPSLSPLGTSVAFNTTGQGGGLFVCGTGRCADSSGTIWSSWQGCEDPEWSPDGQQFVFRYYTDGWIYTCPAGPGGWDAKQRVVMGTCPSWSPDGQWIAYTAGTVGDSDVFRVLADGSGSPVRLTYYFSTNVLCSYPVWSPDGEWIAYAYKQIVSGVGKWSLRVVHAWGACPSYEITPLGQITIAHGLSWSEDGSRIALELADQGIWIASDLGLSPSAVAPATWGAIKSSYR